MNKNNVFKKFSILSMVLLGLSALFTLLLISFNFDISFFAVFVAAAYVGISFYFLGIKIIKNTNGKHIDASSRIIEFLPYVLFIAFIMRRAGEKGTAFWYDLITVLLWVAIFVLSIIVSRKLDIRRCTELVKGWAVAPAEKKYRGIGKFFYEAGDWIYSIVWAIFSVMLFQIFAFQLYEIPSESMVPTFLVKDRVIVSKIDCGPKFPLTDVGLPTFRKYKRGDTVVLRNPHYSMDRKSEVKTVTSQLVYMLTFMTVNLNTDENGQMKADPLVKRVTGLPGEQLVMQDGVLYTRTKDSDEFVPSTIDAKYATWNLNALPRDVYSKVRNPLFSDNEYNMILELEEKRRNFDLDLAVFEAEQAVRDFERAVGHRQLEGYFDDPSMNIGKLFSNINDIAYDLFSKNDGKEWFAEFMTSWIDSKDNVRDIYAEANFRLNVMTKITFGKLVAKYAEAYASSDFNSLQTDFDFINNLHEADLLNWYIQGLLDSRNMPVFPANDKAGNPTYIPKDCYFMMGDNRFNSLDLRHSNDRSEKNLSEDDSMSISYLSLMAPQYINKKYIIGKPIFKFWPINRMGKV